MSTVLLVRANEMIGEPGPGNPPAAMPHPDEVSAKPPGNVLWRILVHEEWRGVRRGLLAVLWLTLAILTHIPVPQSVQGMNISDKLAHVVGYFPLGVLLPLCRANHATQWRSSLLILAGYGIVDELLQIPVGRTASVLDWVADVIGVLLGLGVGQLLLSRQHQS